MKYRQENKFTGSYLYVREDDESEEKRYDVTGLTSLSEAFNEKGMTYEILYVLISSLMKEGRCLEAEDRDMNGWILDPEYIYLRLPALMESGAGRQSKNAYDYHNQIRQKSEVRFIYFSGKSDLSLEKELLNLAEFVIEHIDYRDKDAVNIAYEFYMRIYRGNYVLDDLLQ